MKRRRILPILCLLLAFALGCDEDNTTEVTFQGPITGLGVTINLVGRCGGGATGVVCEDNSTTTPAGHVQVASMVLRNAAGDTVQSADLPGGCGTAPSLPCNIEFPGLSPGVYSVTHTVTPDDGGSVARTTYRDLEVTGSANTGPAG